MSSQKFLSTVERESFVKDPKNSVSAKDVQIKTDAITVSVGLAEDSNTPVPRPDLSGLRLTPLNGTSSGPFYLVNPEGYLMLIPDAATYNNLFRDWNGIIKTDISGMAQGTSITSGAVLVTASNVTRPVCFAGNGVIRGIPSPAVMNNYYFSWAQIVKVPGVIFDSMPVGAVWQ